MMRLPAPSTMAPADRMMNISIAVAPHCSVAGMKYVAISRKPIDAARIRGIVRFASISFLPIDGRLGILGLLHELIEFTIEDGDLQLVRNESILAEDVVCDVYVGHSKRLAVGNDRGQGGQQTSDHEQERGDDLAQILPLERTQLFRIVREVGGGREELLADQRVVAGGHEEWKLGRHGRAGDLDRTDGVCGLGQNQGFRVERPHVEAGGGLLADLVALDAGRVAELSSVR